MRFLFTIHNFFPEPIFGAEKVCIQQMRVLLKRGHKVGVFYPCKSPVSPTQLAEHGLEGLELYRTNFLKTKAQVLLSAWKPHISKQFASAIDDFTPDAIVFHHLLRLSLDLPSVAHSRGIPTAYYLHDFYFVCPSYSLLTSDGKICKGGGLLKCPQCLYSSRFKASIGAYLAAVLFGLPFMLLRDLFIKRLEFNIDLFVSPSRFLIEELNRNGFPCPSHVIIPYGGHGKAIPNKRSYSDKIRFGYIGNIAAKKGIDILVKAFRDLPEAYLVIRGFPDQNSLDSFRKKFPGFEATLELFDTNKESFYYNIDVLVVPSLWYENQPNVIIEAFNRGKVVICSNLGGMAEMVQDQRGGLLFSPGDSDDLRDKVKFLVENPAEVERLASSVPQWPTAQEQADRLMEALDRISSARCGNKLTENSSQPN